jgi:hypothetical protein
MLFSPAAARRPAVLLVVAALLWCLVLTGLPSGRGVAGADTAADERTLAGRLDDLRSARGLATLPVDLRLSQQARDWSARMAAADRLSHNPDLATTLGADWTRLGQNVGSGTTATEVHDQLVDSAPHLSNMVSPSFNAVGIGVVAAGGRVWVTQIFMLAPPESIVSEATGTVYGALSDGTTWYRLVAARGETFGFGAVTTLPSVAAESPVVGAAPTPSGLGAWMVTSSGSVHTTGDAPALGSLAGTPLNQPIVGIAATPSGRGYWLVGRDGGVFSFGDARFLGSTGATRLNQPIVGITASATGNGYWFVAADGGVFSFGDARFLGSTGAMRLSQPVVAMGATGSGQGYWLVGRDGGVFAFGDAPFLGSTGAVALAKPIVAMARTKSSRGYRFVAADGGVFSFGDASFLGSAAGRLLVSPVVALLAGG